MNVVHKAALTPGTNVLRLPLGTEFLSVAMQRGTPTLWYRRPVFPPTMEARAVYLTGTGHEFPEDDYRFIGTMMTEDHNFVFHVFEIGQPEG